MRRIALMLSILMVAPIVAQAQRGGRTRSGATTHDDMFPTDQMRQRATTVTSSKLRDLDPLAILLDKHGDLALSDSQVARLRTMNGQLGDLQKPAYRALDSLDQALANVGSNPSSDDQARMRTMNMFVRMITKNVRQQYDSVERDAGALLNDDQKKKANDALKDSHDQLARLLGSDRSR
ncbi:MAG TPA: hypothetical protein VF737_12180 [Gemmatimonadaceae bacterium]